MKNLLISTIAVLALAAFSSCEVCTTCTYTYELAGQTVEAVQPEVCGSRSEINDVEDAAEAAAETLATGLGGASASASCVRD